jgi:hypothetical protein
LVRRIPMKRRIFSFSQSILAFVAWEPHAGVHRYRQSMLLKAEKRRLLDGPIHTDPNERAGRVLETIPCKIFSKVEFTG